MTRSLAIAFALAALLLAGCGAPTLTPDYTVKVATTPDGKLVAIPPPCPSWSQYQRNVFDNQPDPQFGCATARNLAAMVDNPEDLLQAHKLGPARGITTAGSILRYDRDQTRGLIYPSSSVDTSVDTTTAPTSASPLNGDSNASGSGGGSSGGGGGGSGGSSGGGGASNPVSSLSP